MNDTPRLPHAGRLKPSGRQYRSTSQSPTRPRQVSDDLISHLSPMNAIEAFRTPSGSLKTCMDAASATEQAFAMRAALASKNIYEWLDELEEWPWPEEGGSSGFGAPLLKRRKLSFGRNNGLSRGATMRPSTPPKETVHLGSLPAADVMRYERRIDEIQHDMEKLDVEEIKQHVLHNHILPLSRPGTPMSDNRSTSSFSSYTRMDDLTATITATVVQALPNLSKLTRLMNTWTVRLAVLRRVPVMLKSLSDAEVAIQSGWNAIEIGAQGGSEDTHREVSTLSRKDFEIMKLVLEKKVAKAARDLDYMLDSLEGREDTLPDEWCDRMDAVEHEYSSWVAACERKIQEAQWLKLVEARTMSVSNTLGDADKVKDQETHPVATQNPGNDNSTEFRLADSAPSDQTGEAASPRDTQIDINPRHEGSQGSTHLETEREHEKVSSALDNTESPANTLPEPQISADGVLGKEDTVSNLQEVLPSRNQAHEQDAINTDILLHAQQEGRPVDPESIVSSIEEPETSTEEPIDFSTIRSEPIPTVQISPAKAVAPSTLEDGIDSSFPDLDLDLDYSTLDQGGQMERELSLPPLHYQDSRPSTSASDTSTVIHPLSRFRESSSDLPDFVETPELPQIQNNEERPSDQISPPSSPPGYRTNTRASSVSFIDMPPLAEASDDDTPPKTPLESSFMDDSDISQDIGSPSKMSQASNADDQLQQQISDILESIPAKIHLSSQPSAINLNPPDLQLPYTKPRPVDRPVRSHSSLSSRASTPSFMLAPAYARNSRARHQRGNQEIKLYHLSRSTGEPPIKLFIRCVGENGERVMVRVGGGWADLGEYLKDYASHHGRRSGAGNEGKVEIRDLPRVSVGRTGSSPPSRPASAMDSPITPLNVRKTRKSVGEETAGARFPKTPLATALFSSDPPSSGSTRSRSSSRLSWTEEDSTLGMAGPKAKNIEMSDESKAWVESVKEKVRIASGDRKPPDTQAEGKFGELGKVGGTKRVFRRGPA